MLANHVAGYAIATVGTACGDCITPACSGHRWSVRRDSCPICVRLPRPVPADTCNIYH
jgi:hypothetical protein